MSHAAEIINSKINAVEFCLETFTTTVDENNRKKMLRDNFGTIPHLKIYFYFTSAELKIEKQQLQKLQISENKNQRATTKGNFCRVYCYIK